MLDVFTGPRYHLGAFFLPLGLSRGMVPLLTTPEAALDSFLIAVAACTLAGLALVTAAVSLYLHLRTGSLHELVSHVRQLDLDVHEAFDVIEKWTRRDRVRRLREGRENADTPNQPERPLSPAELKAALRARAAL